MARYACPICGDPNAFPIWIDAEPPEGCPDDDEWHAGRAPSIRNVSECSYQRRKAEQRVEWMRLVPDAFDEAGKLKSGELARVLQAYSEKHPGKPIVI